MKKCPNCQKEFPDNMRFCQTDGTPLIESADAQADDPLKTTVVRQEDFASSIPSSDPYKTTVGGSQASEDSDDLLQLPEEFDPMKTMVVAPLGQNKPSPNESKFEDIKEEIKSESSTPFDVFSQPSDPLPQAPKDISNEPTIAQPEPPKFNEPSLSPPSFGDLSSSPKQDDENLPQTMIQNSWETSAPQTNESPFSKPSETPMSSPFDAPKPSFDEPKPSYDAPQSPFGQPPSPFDAPQSSFDQPKSSFDQPQSAFENQPSPFDAPQASFQEPSANQFGSQFDQMNQGFGNQPLQASEWTPPTPPEQSWGDQGLGANTPFQPPAAGVGGQNNTLAIVSLVSGILSLTCCGALTGIIALITGYMAKNNADQNPAEYGGRGLALAGMIMGAISLVLTVILIIVQIMFGTFNSF